MSMNKININEEYINLSQFLKIINVISSGGQAKYFLDQCPVYVNDILENRRGRKLYVGDIIVVGDESYLICN